MEETWLNAMWDLGSCPGTQRTSVGSWGSPNQVSSLVESCRCSLLSFGNSTTVILDANIGCIWVKGMQELSM